MSIGCACAGACPLLSAYASACFHHCTPALWGWRRASRFPRRFSQNGFRLIRACGLLYSKKQVQLTRYLCVVYAKPNQTTSWIHLFKLICTYHTCAYTHIHAAHSHVLDKTPYATVRQPGSCLCQMFIWQGPIKSKMLLGSRMRIHMFSG